MNLGPQFALPGMEDMTPAQPHEQTPAQFHNRPDVFFHGRMEDPRVSRSDLPRQRSWDFHAGTSQSARDRMEDLGLPRAGKEARFFAGQVDPDSMQNPPPTGNPHDPPPLQVVKKGPNRYTHRVIKDPANEWRINDPGEGWDPADTNSYYRNEAEDIGSTSVLLNSRSVAHGYTFTPWRTSVEGALESGERVPHHVKAIYDVSGGPDGPVTHEESGYSRPQRDQFAYRREQTALPLEGNTLYREKRYKGLTWDETSKIDKAKGL